jgi:Mn-dependent DtxR family transcriptional regulator
MDKDLTPIDKVIVEMIRGEKKPVSTYKLAKETKLSWSTVNSHCYKLKSFGILDMASHSSPFGRKKLLWNVRRKK